MDEISQLLLTSDLADATRYALEFSLLLMLLVFCAWAAVRNHLIGHVRPAIAALALFLLPLTIRIGMRGYVQGLDAAGISSNHNLLNSWFAGLNDWLFLAATALLFFEMVLSYSSVHIEDGEKTGGTDD